MMNVDHNFRSNLKHDVFLRMAVELSRLGTCCRLKVGCVILRADGSIASGGYNGALPGMKHCNTETCNANQRCLHTSHAEENALNFCSGPISIAYITNEPCLTCTRALARRNVQQIIYLHPYSSIKMQEKLERDAIIDHFKIKWINLSLS
jgi:dCMP deaminase